jgi:multicomponent K+:H+ antiporter subunit D
MRVLWAESDRELPRVTVLEALPISFLLLLCFGLTVGAGRIVNYMDHTARDLASPAAYIGNVLGPGGEAAQ